MIGCIIQARMGLSRLPGKVFMNLEGTKTVLAYTVEQLTYCKHVDKIVIATTKLKEDDKVVDFAKKSGIGCFRGNSTNVLDRYYNCAKKFHFSIIVRITADCPLIDPQIVDMAIEKFQKNSYDYVTNCLKRTYPYGTEVEVFSFWALEEAWKNAVLPSEKEHVTPYFRKHPERFRIYNIEYNEDISNYRWTVDRENDLLLVKKVVTKIKERPILMEHIISLVMREPTLLQINNNNIPNEGYLKSLKEDEKFLEHYKND